MKKHITLFLLLITSTIGIAQVTVGVKVNNPLLYGSSISPLYDKEGKKLDTYGNWGFFNSGAFARIPLKEKHWVLQTELLYKNEGTHIRYDETFENRRHFSFEYIDAPCLLQ